jgi:hypothetical protein
VQAQLEKLDNQARESQKWFAGIRQEIKQRQEKLSQDIQENIQTQFKELREEVHEVKEIVQTEVAEIAEISNEGQKACTPVSKELSSELTDQEKAGEILPQQITRGKDRLERDENKTMEMDNEVAQLGSTLRQVEGDTETSGLDLTRRLGERNSQSRTQDHVVKASNIILAQTAETSAVNNCSNKAVNVSDNKFSESEATASCSAMINTADKRPGTLDAGPRQNENKAESLRDYKQNNPRNKIPKTCVRMTQKLSKGNVLGYAFKMTTDRSISSFTSPMTFSLRLSVRTQMQGRTNECILELTYFQER